MKKNVIYVVILLFSIQINVFSQSSDDLFRYADSIKSIKGEESVEYLDALSVAIEKTDDLKKAFEYRKYHSKIVTQKYSELSKEFSIDMCRLGNISTKLNNIDSANYYYKKCIDINDNLNEVDTMSYLSSIKCLADNYYKQEYNNPEKNFDNPNYKLNIAEELYEKLIDKIDMYNIPYALWNKVNARYWIGCIQLFKQETENALDNFLYVVDNALLVQDTVRYMYANLYAYDCYGDLADYYFNNENIPKLIECRKNEIHHCELVYYNTNGFINHKQQLFYYDYLLTLYSYIASLYVVHNNDYNSSILYTNKALDLLLINEGNTSPKYISKLIHLIHLYTDISNCTELLKIIEGYNPVIISFKDNQLVKDWDKLRNTIKAMSRYDAVELQNYAYELEDLISQRLNELVGGTN